MIRYLTLLIAGLMMIGASCTIKGYDTERLASDFKTDGFLDADHFQIIVVGKPAAGRRGLIEQRESAMEEAKAMLEKTVLDKLLAGVVTIHDPGSKSPSKNAIAADKQNAVKSELQSLMKYGYTAFEYYNEDNAAIIVYRIFKKDLKNKIESLHKQLVAENGGTAVR